MAPESSSWLWNAVLETRSSGWTWLPQAIREPSWEPSLDDHHGSATSQDHATRLPDCPAKVVPRWYLIHVLQLANPTASTMSDLRGPTETNPRQDPKLVDRLSDCWGVVHTPGPASTSKSTSPQTTRPAHDCLGLLQRQIRIGRRFTSSTEPARWGMRRRTRIHESCSDPQPS